MIMSSSRKAHRAGFGAMGTCHTKESTAAPGAAETADGDAPPSPLALIPDQLASIASYLDAPDALALDTCGGCARCVRVEGIYPFEKDSVSFDGSHGYAAFKFFDLPPCARAHTVRLDFLWRDQGWGNRKGALCVVRGSGSAPDDWEAHGPHVLAALEPAPHTLTRGVLAFPVPAGETLSLWAKVGGGGGHSLTVIGLRRKVLAHRPPF